MEETVQVQCLPLLPNRANCFVVTSGNSAVVIDPGSCPQELMDALQGKQVAWILLTHGHFDHMLGVHALREKTGAAVGIHEGDAACLLDENESFAYRLFRGQQQPVRADKLLQDGGSIPFGSAAFTVLHTPGHSPGSVCFCEQNSRLLFTGDTLFARTVGSTEFPRGNWDDMQASLRKLINLPGDYTVYPGHERKTTLQTERDVNTYIKDLG